MPKRGSKSFSVSFAKEAFWMCKVGIKRLFLAQIDYFVIFV